MTLQINTRGIATIGLLLNTIGASLLIFFPLGVAGSYANGIIISYAFRDNVVAYLASVTLALGFPFQIWAIWRTQ
jgi:hypothetical protein